MCKLAKYVRNCVVFWKNLHSWQKFYTTAGRDGRDKFQVWLYQNSFLLGLSICCALQELCALHAVNVCGKDPPTSLQSPLSKIQTKPSLHFYRRSCHPQWIGMPVDLRRHHLVRFLDHVFSKISGEKLGSLHKIWSDVLKVMSPTHVCKDIFEPLS